MSTQNHPAVPQPVLPQPGLKPVLKVLGLHKQFVLHNVDGRTVESLIDVNLTIEAGEHVALAGSSGAGKSSLLKCIYRTYLPTAGTVVLTVGNGQTIDITALADDELIAIRNREIGYVSQFLHAPARRSPFQVVARAAQIRGLDHAAANDAAAAALGRLHLDEALWDVYANVLSGGERQRVNLAAGTVSPPRLLLLDEPVSALDPANREAALGLIADLTSSGVAVLAIYHDLDAIARLASSVVMMQQGRITATGPTDQMNPLIRKI